MAIAAAADFQTEDGDLELRDWDSAVSYSTGADREFAGGRVDASTTPDVVADLILSSLPLSLYRAILPELKSRGVIRTENAPVGDYGEYLVATAPGSQLAPNSENAWDVLGNDGEKLQVEAPGDHGPSGRNRAHRNPPGGTNTGRESV